MSAEGAGSPDANADFDRCLELAAADPQGDDMFSTLISVWAYYLSRAELDRARQVSETLRDALGGRRDVFRPQNLAGFGMLDWFAGRFGPALEALTAATGDLAEIGGSDDVAAAWFVPNDPAAAMHAHLGLARFMAGDLAGADACLARAHAVAAGLEFPSGPWSAAYATWLGSWISIEAGRLDRAAQALAEVRAASDRHGFANWELISATQTAVLEGVRALLAGDADADALAAHADEVGAHIEVWRMLELRLFLPFHLTTAGALSAAAGDADGARERYAASLRLADETGMRFYDAETRRRLAQLESGQDARRAALEDALALARTQGARPFEQRIARDLEALARA
jgi:tetratricopeptide (TPR) repeat protein